MIRSGAGEIREKGLTLVTDNAIMDAQLWMERLNTLGYRLAAYAMLNLADDAAMLALVFC